MAKIILSNGSIFEGTSKECFEFQELMKSTKKSTKKSTEKSTKKPTVKPTKAIKPVELVVTDKSVKFNRVVAKALWKYNHKLALECGGTYNTESNAWYFTTKANLNKFTKNARVFLSDKELEIASNITFERDKSMDTEYAIEWKKWIEERKTLNLKGEKLKEANRKKSLEIKKALGI